MYRMGATNKMLTFILATLVVINVYSLGYMTFNKALAQRQPEQHTPFQSHHIEASHLIEAGIGETVIFINHDLQLAHEEEQHTLQHELQPVTHH
jgi:hypothetical protein